MTYQPITEQDTSAKIATLKALLVKLQAQAEKKVCDSGITPLPIVHSAIQGICKRMNEIEDEIERLEGKN